MTLTLKAIEYPPGSGTYNNIDWETTDYGGMFELANRYGAQASVNEVQRAGAAPLFQSISLANRIIPITLARKSGGSVDRETFLGNVFKWFDPAARDSSGDTTRYLKVIANDGSTELRIPVNVVSVQTRSGSPAIIDVAVQATWPYFEKITAESQGTWGTNSPNNSGNANAPVLLTITGGTSPTSAYRFTITDATGEGVTDVPVVLDPGTNAFGTNAKLYLFDQNGASKRFTVTSSRYVWTTVSLGPNESVFFWAIYYTSFPDNPKANTIDLGTFYTSNTSNTSNQSDGFQISGNPARNGLWQLAQLGFVGGGGGNWGYEVTEASTNIVFTTRDAANKAKNDANGMTLVTGIPADSLTGLSRVTANHTSNIRSFLRYRQAGDANWTDAWTQTASATVTTSITLVDAVEIAAGIEVTGDSPTDSATLTLSGTGTPDITVTYDTSKDLTVSATNIVSLVGILNGNITNSATGQVITFDNLIYYDTGTEALIIDTRHDATERIKTENTDGAILGLEGALTFSDPILGMSIAPGTNTCSETLAASVTFDFRSTFS